MKKLLLLALANSFALSLPACSDKDDDAKPSTPAVVETDFRVGLYLETGTSSDPTRVTAGLARTQAEAAAGNGTIWTGSITRADVASGTSKVFTVGRRPKGEKLWLFVSTDRALVNGRTNISGYDIQTPQTSAFSYNLNASFFPQPTRTFTAEVTIP